MSEQQRVALVTGAAGGIGRAMVHGLLGQGLAVAAVDRSAEGLAALVEGAAERQQAANLLATEADLADEASIPRIIADARARFGTIDILVNNAGVGQATIRRDNRARPIKFWEVTPEQWQHLFAIRDRLSAEERSKAETLIALLGPDVRAQFLAELSALSVDDAVRALRTTMRRLAVTTRS